MESYDPRKPIIKAKDDELDEVQGHIKHMRGPEQEPLESTHPETADAGGAGEVEGHIRHMRGPEQAAVPATEDGEAGDPEVEGHNWA